MKRFEKFFIYVALFLAAGVSLSSSDEGYVDTSGGGGIGGYLFAVFSNWGIFAMLLFFCYVRRRVLLPHLRHLITGPLPLALLTVLSISWSVVPYPTAKRSIVVVLNTVLGFYLGAVFDPDELAGIYKKALEIMVFLSIAVIILLPSYGISQGAHTGDWRGAFYHKNQAGEIMAVAFITFGIAPPLRMSPGRRWGLAALSLLLLYKSNASSSIIAAGIALGAQAVWALLMARRKVITGLLLAGYPVVISAVFFYKSYSQELFALVGKDSSFTGRDKVWLGVLDGIALRPWLGYGFLAFWAPEAGFLFLIRERTGFVPSHAHNGYLNLLLHVGIVGMGLFLIFLLRLIWVTICEGRRTHSPVERWFFSYLVLILAANVTESHILEMPFFWISMAAFYTTFSVKRAKSHKLVQESNPLTSYAVPVLASDLTA